MIRRRLWWIIPGSTVLVAVVIWMWPKHDEYDFIRQLGPREFDYELLGHTEHVFELDIPFPEMRRRLEQHWGTAKAISDDEVCYRLPPRFKPAVEAYLDAGRYDQDFMRHDDTSTVCYVTLTRYQPTWLDRQIRAVKKLLRLN